jgi:hypothetical protein
LPLLLTKLIVAGANQAAIAAAPYQASWLLQLPLLPPSPLLLTKLIVAGANQAAVTAAPSPASGFLSWLLTPTKPLSPPLLTQHADCWRQRSHHQQTEVHLPLSQQLMITPLTRLQVEEEERKKRIFKSFKKSNK